MEARRAIATEIEGAVQSFATKVEGHFDVTGMILFGSRARKTHRPDSDVDIAVLLRGQSGEFTSTKLALADIAYDVLLETGIRFQPLPIWEEEWKHPETYSNPQLLRSIERQGIRL